MPTEETHKFKFTIGCDPEFNMVFQGRKLHAQNTMQKVLNGKPGFSSASGGFDTAEGNIGWDGASTTAEIRIKQTNNIDEFVNRMDETIKKLSSNFPGVEFSTLNEFAPIGGHIHLAVPEHIDANGTTFKKQLDKFFPFLIPITLSENKISATVRIKTSYGAITDLRFDHKFTNQNGTPGYTCEVRCPTAEWTSSKKITRATIAYLAVVWNELTAHPKSFITATAKLPRTKEQIKAVHLLAMSNYEDGASPVLKEIKKHIKNFELYDKYKEEIEFILNPKEVVKEKKECLYEATRGWGFAKEAAKITKTEFMSEKAIKDTADKENLDNKTNPNYIIFNKDFKVDQFAGALNERIIAFGWKPENTYVLFGLRKGIPEIVARNRRGEYIVGENMIKTKGDLTQMESTFKKLETKLSSSIGTPGKKIDIVSEKIIDTKSKTILIGIPYDMRTKEDTKTMLSTIYDIENKKYKPKKIVADTNAKEAGIIEKAYANKTEGTKDESSQYTVETGNSQAVTRIREAWDSISDDTEEDTIAIVHSRQEVTEKEIVGTILENHPETTRSSDNYSPTTAILIYNALSEEKKITLLNLAREKSTNDNMTIPPEITQDLPSELRNTVLASKQIYLLKLIDAMKDGYDYFSTYQNSIHMVKFGNNIFFINRSTNEHSGGDTVLESIEVFGIIKISLSEHRIDMSVDISNRSTSRISILKAMTEEEFATYYQNNRI